MLSISETGAWSAENDPVEENFHLRPAVQFMPKPYAASTSR
ncbi:hypothetical protein MP11Mi_14030 [Gordonia sp. MP11Mi]|uniref:Uncharacterized protein n=1 Tax=Gordonia sp. MP11Mi TaxID=3022769 RepID=A0AA97CWW6_9ACTN